MLDDSTPPSPPHAFGPYRVVQQVGVGVLGPVFRASAPDETRAIALKAFHLDLPPEQSSTFASVLQETVHVGTVHPVLVAPIAAGLSDLVPYLASEFVAAPSLDTVVRHDATVSVQQALPFVVQLAEGFDAAHAAGLTHGALHLRDLFVTAALPRVTGFGPVAALERVGLQAPLRRPYTAPEQIAGEGRGAAADRFALAAIVYEMLTGRRAVGTHEQLLERLGGVAGVRDVGRVTRLFAAALAERPAARPGSAAVFAGELAEAVDWSGVLGQSGVLVGAGAADTAQDEDDDPAARPIAPGTDLTVGHAADEGPETTGAGIEGADMAIRRKPEPEPEPEVDWSERSLDRAEPDVMPPDGGDAHIEELPVVVAEDQVAVAEENVAFEEDDVETGQGDDAMAADDLRAGEPALAAGDAEDRETGPDAGGSEEGDGGGYGTIVLTGRDDRLAHVDDGEDTVAMDREEEMTPVVTHRFLSPPSGDVRYAGDNDDDAEPDATEYAGAENDDEPDEVLIGGAVEGWTPSARRSLALPFVAVAVVVAAAAFAIGFGLVGGSGSPDADAPSDTMLAGGGTSVPAPVPQPETAVPPAADAALEPPADAAVGQEFSEVTVSDVPAGGTAESTANRSGANLPAPSPRRAQSAASARPPVPRPTREPVAAARTPSAPAVRQSPLRDPAPPRPIREPAVQAPAPPAPAQRSVVADGRLLVRTTPPGAQVVVNGEVRGTTPLALSQLPHDNYDVVLTLDGYESQERRFTIAAGDPIAAVQADLIRIGVPEVAPLGVGSIFADTRPRGVQVWLDKRLVGETPMLIPDVAAGLHEVEFKQDGYRQWATTVRVDSSTQARVTASLDRAR